MQFRYVLKEKWPGLAWLVEGSKADGLLSVYHGRGVETAPDWFCEAVWDGEFERGEFDLTDVIAGTGARVRNNEVIFVASGNTVDRLQWFENNSTIFVSNSLSCLLSQLDARVDPIYPHYNEDANSVIEGLDRYKSSLATDRGDIRLLYFHNLIWSESGLQKREKPGLGRDFSSFEKYHDFLQCSMALLMKNLHAAQRCFKLKPIGTLSSGYDSTAITVLGKQQGLEEVITFDRAREGHDDGGSDAAQRLGLQVYGVDREDWRKQTLPEVPFVASYSSAEDIVFLGAEPHLRGRVMFTGYHGDKVWDKWTTYLSDQIMRGDSSGLALTEYRLEAGFINCAIPFFGARQVRDVHRINNTEAMKPWDVPGNYSRPICRRIAEEAGLPRQSFGVKKKAITVAGWDVFFDGGNFLTASSREDFLQWIRDHYADWIRRGRVPPIASIKVNLMANYLSMRSTDCVRWISNRTPLWRLLGNSNFEPKYLNRYLFPWAIERMKKRYRI